MATRDIPADFEHIGVQLSLGQYLRESWERRWFAFTVAITEFQSEHQDTVLGNVWHLLNPLLFAGVYYAVFGILFGARFAVENYAAFLLVGLIVFQFTQRTTMAGARTIESNLGLITNLSFPRMLLPTAVVAQETLAQVPALLAVMAIVAATGVIPTPAWLLLIPVLVLHSLFNLGLAMITARLAFHLRDIQIVLPHALRVWLYGSAIFYPLTFVEDHLGAVAATIFAINPMYVFVRLAREVTLGDSLGGLWWLGACSAAALAIAVGFPFFRAAETEYGAG